MNNEKEKVPGSLLTLTAGVVVTLVSLWFGYNFDFMPEQASQQASLVDNLFRVMVIIGTALFLVIQGAILIAVIKFRQRPGDNTDGPPIKGNLPLEAFWTVIPAIIVIILGVYSVEVYRDMGGFEAAGGSMMSHNHHKPVEVAMTPQSNMAPLIVDTPEESTELVATQYGFGATPDREGLPADVEVDVMGLQFAWVFTYPDSDIVVGDLHVPVGKDIQLNISAQDVLHAFWIPQFRLKQDAIPGQDTQLRFTPNKIGTYPIVCAELCGSYHGGMRTQITVETQEEYEAWQEEENEYAQKADWQQTVAVTTDLSDSQYLAPYAQEMGMESDALAQVQLSHNEQ